jgi:hypothetical protein
VGLEISLYRNDHFFKHIRGFTRGKVSTFLFLKP